MPCRALGPNTGAWSRPPDDLDHAEAIEEAVDVEGTADEIAQVSTGGAEAVVGRWSSSAGPSSCAQRSDATAWVPQIELVNGAALPFRVIDRADVKITQRSTCRPFRCPGTGEGRHQTCSCRCRSTTRPVGTAAGSRGRRAVPLSVRTARFGRQVDQGSGWAHLRPGGVARRRGRDASADARGASRGGCRGARWCQGAESPAGPRYSPIGSTDQPPSMVRVWPVMARASEESR